MTNLILCGGSGTRLWPVSRTLMPKQFVPLVQNNSLFQLTYERNRTQCSSFYIVSGADQYFLAKDQLETSNLKHKKINFLLEPLAKNTAPAIALACFDLEPNEIVLVTPSDHLIKNTKEYQKAVEQASLLAQKGNLVTFGITPTHPETGYGYVETNGAKVTSFTEKPDKKTAQTYLDSKRYFWNSGMFCFQAGVYLSELQTHASEIYKASLDAYKKALCEDSLMRIKHEDMALIPEQSIDYAVMEKSKCVSVVACDIGWSDLGSFDALDEVLPKDKNQNTKTPHLYTVDAQDNFVYSSNRAIALTDVSNLIIVDTPDALLVAQKGNSQNVKKVVEQLKKAETKLHHIHLTAYRPWGTYTVLEIGQSYKIKRIDVRPGKRLSLQKHFHRNEHWIVVSGTAMITVGDKELLLCPNESTYIPMGKVHRLENPGKIDLVLIEVQVGDYLGEDDIVRFEDDFKRR